MGRYGTRADFEYGLLMGNYKNGHGSFSCPPRDWVIFLVGWIVILGMAIYQGFNPHAFVWSAFWWRLGIYGGIWTLFFVCYFLSDGNDGHPDDREY